MKRTIKDFEQIHGGGKIRELSKQLDIEREKLALISGKHDKVHVLPSTDENVVKFAVCGDTQFGSMYSCPENFVAFLEYAYSRGVKTVLHTGDVLDGVGVYRGQAYELSANGLKAQLEVAKKVAADLPSGMDVRFITGNHDLSFKQVAGVPIGEMIAQATGWKCVGDEAAIIRFTVGRMGYDVGLYHLGGGTAYAVSYKIQKHIESMEGGRKPQMGLYGHYHKADMMPSYRNVCGIQTGTFQWQTPFMQRMASPSHVGGWIIHVQPGKTYNAVQAEFVAFYQPRR